MAMTNDNGVTFRVRGGATRGVRTETDRKSIEDLAPEYCEVTIFESWKDYLTREILKLPPSGLSAP